MISYMKNIIAVFIFIICSLSCTAQIQRNILGYTLGVTNRTTMVKSLESKGFDLEIINDAANKGPVFYKVKGGVSFGGYIWDEVRIGFVNGKFASIMCNTYLTNEQSVKLYNALNSKYSKYSTDNTNPSSNVFDYNDKKTSAFLWIRPSGITTLSYGDEKLMNADTNTSSTNDL